jgi:DNA-directed RNA polymerase subunit M/transcription elongation factor TFIIS
MKQNDTQPTSANVCPACDSTKVAGLMASFFVPLKNGEPDGDWRDWQSDTELTPQRSCADCGHEWESDE